MEVDRIWLRMNMKKKTYEGYTYVDGGVCAAKGFVANGINCGLNFDKNKIQVIPTCIFIKFRMLF